jgi:Fe-S cluster assembly protein SufB
MVEESIEKALASHYEPGFETAIESDSFPPGLDEGVIRKLSLIKKEPDFLLQWRLKAFDCWQLLPW